MRCATERRRLVAAYRVSNPLGRIQSRAGRAGVDRTSARPMSRRESMARSGVASRSTPITFTLGPDHACAACGIAQGALTTRRAFETPRRPRRLRTARSAAPRCWTSATIPVSVSHPSSTVTVTVSGATARYHVSAFAAASAIAASLSRVIPALFARCVPVESALFKGVCPATRYPGQGAIAVECPAPGRYLPEPSVPTVACRRRA